jgi:hypothetical protein
MKTPLKLLMVIAVIVTIAAPAGWKWGPKQKLTRALTYAVAPADATAPDSTTSPDASLAPADATAPDSSTAPDPSLAPADTTAPDAITPPATSVNPDGWTWDTGE